MASVKLAVLVFCVVAASVSAVPTQHEARGNAVQTEDDLLDSIYTDCLRKDSYNCLKMKLFNFVDKMLGHKDTITLADGVEIVKNGGENTDGAPRAINADDSLENILWNRIGSFMESHTIKINLKGSEIVNTVSNTARSFSDVVESLSEEEGGNVDEARKKSKKASKMLGPLLAAMAIKAAFVGKLALAGIALIAGKALIIGKLALILSAIIGLKKLLGGGKHVTYEVVSHPHHSTSHVTSHESVYAGGSGSGGYSSDGGYAGSSGHGGWSRSFDGQPQVAYRGYKQASQQ